MISELVWDFADALAAMPEDHPRRRILRLLEEAIRRDIRFIKRHPTTLFQCVWNTAWWCACPELAEHLKVRRNLRESTRVHSTWVRCLTRSLTPLDAPLVSTLIGHSDSVTAVAITADGRYVVSGSADGTLKVWDLTAGEQRTMRWPDGRQARIWTVALTSCGQLALSGAEDGAITVWDLGSCRPIDTIRHSSSVSALALASNGRHLISGAFNGTLKIWDFPRRALKVEATDPNTLSVNVVDTARAHWDCIHALAVMSDSRLAVSASSDHTLKVWDLATGSLERTLTGHNPGVLAVAVTSQGHLAVSGSYDNTIKVWDVATGDEKYTSRCLGRTSAVALTSDDRYVIAVGTTLEVADRPVGTLSLGNRAKTAKLHGHSGSINCIAVASDDSFAVSGSDDKTLRVWKLCAGFDNKPTFQGHSAPVGAIAVTPDGRHAISGSDDGTLKVWNLETGEEEHTLSGHAHYVRAVIACANDCVLSASWDRTVREWNLDSLESQVVYADYFPALTPTPKYVYLIAGAFFGRLRVWDRRTREPLCDFEGHRAEVNTVAVAPDGLWAVSGSEDPLEDHRLIIWDVQTGHSKHRLIGHTDSVTAVAITPDGRCVVSGSKDSTVRVWDSSTGKLMITLKEHTARVTALAITPDNRYAVSASEDHTLRVWNGGERWQDVKCASVFGAESGILSCCLAPDGRTAVAADASGRVHFLSLEGL